MLLSNRFRAASLGLATCAMLASLPAQAQFGGLMGALGRKSPTTEQATTAADGCPQGKKKSVGSAIMGSIAGSVASRAAGRFASFVPVPEFAGILSNAIACRLDAKEQQQAADATLVATKGDAATGEVKVGDSAEWISASRSDVKGKSTVVAVENAAPPAPALAAKPAKGNAAGKGNAGGKPTQLASAPQCITVSDVIIVNGEETTANKRMCKAPGQARYTLMA